MKYQIEYKEENGILIPQIEMPNLSNLGKYGTIMKNYMKEEKRLIYFSLLRKGKLETTLRQMNKQATEKIIELTEEMFLKSSYKDSRDTMEIYQEKESLKMSAEEIIISEMKEQL